HHGGDIRHRGQPEAADRERDEPEPNDGRVDIEVAGKAPGDTGDHALVPTTEKLLVLEEVADVFHALSLSVLAGRHHRERAGADPECTPTRRPFGAQRDGRRPSIVVRDRAAPRELVSADRAGYGFEGKLCAVSREVEPCAIDPVEVRGAARVPLPYAGSRAFDSFKRFLGDAFARSRPRPFGLIHS